MVCRGRKYYADGMVNRLYHYYEGAVIPILMECGAGRLCGEKNFQFCWKWRLTDGLKSRMLKSDGMQIKGRLMVWRSRKANFYITKT